MPHHSASRGDPPVPPASALECALPAGEKAGKRLVPDDADVCDIAALLNLGESAVRTLLRDTDG